VEAKEKIKLLSGHLSEIDITTINKALEEAKQEGMKGDKLRKDAPFRERIEFVTD
jgi:hypothetical protein